MASAKPKLTRKPFLILHSSSSFSVSFGSAEALLHPPLPFSIYSSVSPSI